MFRFPERQRKQYVECKGPGPHVTKNGSPWLIVGFHSYVQIQDGTVRCKACAERTGRTYLPPDYSKPIGYSYLSEEERTQLRIGLAELRKTYPLMEARERNKVSSKDAGRTEQTTEQRELQGRA